MNQALYAHMNNKRKMKKEKKESQLCSTCNSEAIVYSSQNSRITQKENKFTSKNCTLGEISLTIIFLGLLL
jgi:hypothetical protein